MVGIKKSNYWRMVVLRKLHPLLAKQVWAIGARLELVNTLRNLALFNVAIDSKLRGCDLVCFKASAPVNADQVREGAIVAGWVRRPEMLRGGVMFPSRFHDHPHMSTRQYGQFVRDWVAAKVRFPENFKTVCEITVQNGLRHALERRRCSMREPDVGRGAVHLVAIASLQQRHAV